MNDNFNIINKTKFNINEYKIDFLNIFNEIKNILNINFFLEISLLIVDENFQLKMNKKYRKKNYVADVLTFANIKKDNIFLKKLYKKINFIPLGDILICYEKALFQSKKYNHSLRREFSFLFTHGMLHILGFDHIKKKEEKLMNILQNKILNNLKIYRNIPIND